LNSKLMHLRNLSIVPSPSSLLSSNWTRIIWGSQSRIPSTQCGPTHILHCLNVSKLWPRPNDYMGKLVWKLTDMLWMDQENMWAIWTILPELEPGYCTLVWDIHLIVLHLTTMLCFLLGVKSTCIYYLFLIFPKLLHEWLFTAWMTKLLYSHSVTKKGVFFNAITSSNFV
jgi:hypothetical protein